MSVVVKFEKIVPEGKAMGHMQDGRAVFTIGPLPDEVAEIGVRKHKKTYVEAVLRKLINPSPKRGEAEDHALVCSPWQGVDYAYQCELKTEMITEAMRQHHIDVSGLEFIGSPEQFHYRNRLDFTAARIDGTLQLAFHKRGSWEELVSLPAGCKLGSQRMNAAALDLVARLNDMQTDIDSAVITVRHAIATDQLLTILTTDARADWKRVQTEALDNFLVARPLPGSGAPGPTVFQNGDSFIIERLHNLDIAYPYNAFFQTNIPAFELALKRIIAAAQDAHTIVELYSGAGAIGLPLAASGKIVRGIEIVPEAVEFAERNARANHVINYSADAVAAEKMDAVLLEGADCVILDPPRAGLHPRVVAWLLEAKPKRIIYLSCNPVTQARDLEQLKGYKLHSLTGFDFYPGALHVESLAVLDL